MSYFPPTSLRVRSECVKSLPIQICDMVHEPVSAMRTWRPRSQPCAQKSSALPMYLPYGPASGQKGPASGRIGGLGGGARIHPENARMSGRHGAPCAAYAALTLVVRQYITNLCTCHFSPKLTDVHLATAGVLVARISGRNCGWNPKKWIMFRALPTETKVEGGTSQSKSGTSVTLSNSGESFKWSFSAKAVLAGRYCTPRLAN